MEENTAAKKVTEMLNPIFSIFWISHLLVENMPKKTMILAKITIKTNYLIFVGFTAVLVIIQSFIPARLGRFVW